MKILDQTPPILNNNFKHDLVRLEYMVKINFNDKIMSYERRIIGL